ncbi:MAG TPA: DNA adenine methylase [Ignavibacteriaceae bacterium]|nr:DNA adenine methylase [Ignavibacteriaceae bacterium]
MQLLEKKYAKPFLKWAGGKTHLLEQFIKYFPAELKNGEIKNYYEPFLGSGAVFFFIAQNYRIERAFLSDINEELILTFNAVKNDALSLIDTLKNLKHEYYSINDNKKESYFYRIRDKYNKEKSRIDFSSYSSGWIDRAAQMIFLNKTCYNGLFRLNKKGEFNVPVGRYKYPDILNEDNLLRVSETLQVAEIGLTDFERIKKNIRHNSFIYFDPPYRPLSRTANFTSYSKYDFGEEDQLRLARLFKELGINNNKLLLSNSDPKNENPDDNFFEKAFKGFRIKRVKANRMINCDAGKRGSINELIITNY